MFYQIDIPREFWEAFVVEANSPEEAIERTLQGLAVEEINWNTYGNPNLDSNTFKVHELPGYQPYIDYYDT